MAELPHQLKEIYWHSRRGMLELELRLVPFVRDCFESLNEGQQAAYVELLAEEDWQIFDWLQGRLKPESEAMQELIDRIIAHRGTL
jgi:antitoxin CptB